MHRPCNSRLLTKLHPLVAGIGKSIAFKLARQGLNVVLVALGDKLLDDSFEEINATFPKQQFRKVRRCMGHAVVSQIACSSWSCSSTLPLLQPAKSGTCLERHGCHPLPQVAANLGKEGYLEDITKATDDIDVQLVFNNAGYLLTGFFHNRCGGQEGFIVAAL